MHYFIRAAIIDLTARIDERRKSWAILGLWPHTELDKYTISAVNICYKALLRVHASEPWKVKEINWAYSEVMKTPHSK